MAKIIRPLAFLIGIGLIAVLAALLVSGVVALTVGLPAASYIYPGSPGTVALAVLNLFFVVGIPATMLILAIMRVFMRSNFRPRWRFGLWAFWLINVIGMFAIGSFTLSQFSHAAEPQKMGSEPLAINSDTLFVEMERSPAREALIQFGDNSCISGDQFYNGHIHLNFLRSKSGNFEIEQVTQSRGKSIREAEQLANNVDYQYRLEGNRLVLPSYFIIPKGEKWRGQFVELKIYVPDGKFVHRGHRTTRFTNYVQDNPDHRFSIWHSGDLWQMTPKGMISPEEIAKAQQHFDFSDFSKIRVEGNIEMRLRQGDKFNIDVTDGERLLDRLDISQSDDRLTLRSEANHRFGLDVTLPDLSELWVIDGREVEMRDFKLKKLRIVNEAEADIKIFADIDSLQAELTGQNELELRGNGFYLEAYLSDGAELDAGYFEVKNAKLEVQDRSGAKVSVADTIWRQPDGGKVDSRHQPVLLDLGGQALDEEQ